MFPKATSGNDGNNRKFSQCSIDYISPVLDTKNECFQRKYFKRTYYQTGW